MTVVILGIDPGGRRYGVAVADEETRFARPLEIIDATLIDPVERIATLVAELGASIVVVGRAISLSGAEGPAVALSDNLATALRARTTVDVIQYDERFTSSLAEAGRRVAARRSRRREPVDDVAAQLMLQAYLDASAASR